MYNLHTQLRNMGKVTYTDFADHNTYLQWESQKLMWSHKKLPAPHGMAAKLSSIYVKNLALTMRYKFIVKDPMIKWLMNTDKQTQRQDEYVTLLWLLLFLLSNHWDPCESDSRVIQHTTSNTPTLWQVVAIYMYCIYNTTKNWPSSFLSLGSLASTLSLQSPSALCFSSRGFPGW